MALFQPRVFPEIMGDMIAKVVSVTPLTDLNFGSVFTTMLEAAAMEDDEQYFQMLEIIRAYSLDTTTGTDLDLRAQETVGDRLDAEKATSFVTVTDTSFTKVVTNTYSGSSGAGKDDEEINGDSATGFAAAGNIIVGRDTPNAETIGYSSITQFSNYVRFNLIGGLQFDHGTDETIIFAQGGNRNIPSGIVVYVPESDISERVEYVTTAASALLDGEDTVTGIPIEAVEEGAESNVPIGSIRRFDSKPFPTAEVTNPSKITNGRGIESDQELRDRIKDYIQSLSRGTGVSIITGISGLVSTTDNKRVVSSSLIEPTTPADVVKLFIDDGAETIFDFNHVGNETIISSATGGEKFLKTINTPLVKAFSETGNEEPFVLNGGEELFVDVGGIVETVLFESTNFETPGEASAQEVLKRINLVAKLFEARVSSNGKKVKIFSRSNSNEEITVTGGSANSVLNFQTDTKFTLKLYRTRENEVGLLSKDGKTATIEAGNTQGYNFGSDSFIHLTVAVDGKTDNLQYLKLRPTIDFVNPASATVEEIVALANARVPGLFSQESSNGNKFRFSSNTERSSNSKIRIIENFTDILSEEASVLVDRKSDLQNAASQTVIFGADLDYMYFFHSVKFGSLFVKLAVLASANIDFALEYWNGTAWTEIGVHDTTIGFTQDGHIFFEPPYDWELTSVSGKSGYVVRLQRNQAIAITPPEATRIRVCGANEEFGFSETEVVGANKDYTVNRFIGQIELSLPAELGDKYEVGTLDSRAKVTTIANGNYGGLVGQQLEILIDGVLQAYTFVSGDFFTPASALPDEVRDAINTNFSGITASSNGLKVEILVNGFSGSLQVSNSGANSVLQFPTDLKESLVSHIAATESTIAGPYNFIPDDNLIVIYDGNLANTIDTPMYHTESLTGFVSTTIIIDTKLNTIFPLDTDLENYEILINDGPEAGERRTITAYQASTGRLTLDSALGGDPGTAEYFIFPTTTDQIVRLISRTKVTLLSINVDILESNNGLLQLSSKNSGEDGSIQVSGGNANAKLGFSTSEVLGVDGYRYLIGLPQIVQWTVDGKEDDPLYDGIRAAGVQVEVAEPVKELISIQLDVTPQEGTTLSSLTNNVKSAVTGVVNALGVGKDVILSDITVAVKGVAGVFDVEIISPSDNIAIADNQQARVNEKDIAIG